MKPAGQRRQVHQLIGRDRPAVESDSHAGGNEPARDPAAFRIIDRHIDHYFFRVAVIAGLGLVYLNNRRGLVDQYIDRFGSTAGTVIVGHRYADRKQAF